MSTPVVVIKKNFQGEEVWRYSGTILARNDHAVLLQATFNNQDTNTYGMWMRKGDRFLEVYFSDRWYNVFEIYDRETGRLKGWYCNIAQPAIIAEDSIAYIDMALDLLVFPDGRQVVLDMDEFNALAMDGDMRIQALAALEELKIRFSLPARVDVRDLLHAPD
ncbi:MAG: DUF402 domain-containing protein [Anaerolineae bacterium]|jgi:hypothetical protein|nr:DUF402 domain-containing protein [Anaerolineae bacterium]